MKQIIQIIGTNASGKSTSVRKFIERYEDIQVLRTDNVHHSLYTLCDGGKAVVMGDYTDPNCTTPGCDRMSGQKEVLESISWVIKQYQPEVVIYEGILYGSMKFILTMSSFAKRKGYEWVGIFLQRDFMSGIALLEKRNNGGDYNIANISSKYTQYDKNFLKCKKHGLNVVRFNPDEVEIDKMGEYIA